MNKDYTEDLLEAIELLVDQRLADIATDTITIGTILSVPNENSKTQQYRVQTGTTQRWAIANPELKDLKVNTQVCVTIFSDEKEIPYISSIYKATDEEFKTKITKPLDTILEVYKTLPDTESLSIGPSSSSSSFAPDGEDNWKHIPIPPADYQSLVEYIGFTLTIDTNMPEVVDGNYYIEFAVNGNHSKTYPISAKKQLFGNIYDYEGGFEQTVLYKIDPVDTVTDIAYRLVQDGKFKVTRTRLSKYDKLTNPDGSLMYPNGVYMEEDGSIMHGDSWLDNYFIDKTITISNIVAHLGQAPRESSEVTLSLSGDDSSFLYIDESNKLLTARVIFPDPVSGVYKACGPQPISTDSNPDESLIPREQQYTISLKWYKYNYTEKIVDKRWVLLEHSGLSYNAPLDKTIYETQYKVEAYMTTWYQAEKLDEFGEVVLDEDGKIIYEEKANEIKLGEASIIFKNNGSTLTQGDIELLNVLATKHDNTSFQYDYNNNIVGITNREINVYYTNNYIINNQLDWALWEIPKNNSMFEFFAPKNYGNNSYYEINKYYIDNNGYKISNEPFNPNIQYYKYDNTTNEFLPVTFSFNTDKNLFRQWQIPFCNYQYNFLPSIPNKIKTEGLSLELYGDIEQTSSELNWKKNIVLTNNLNPGTVSKNYNVRLFGELGIINLPEGIILDPLKGDCALEIRYNEEQKNGTVKGIAQSVYLNYFKTLNNRQNHAMEFSFEIPFSFLDEKDIDDFINGYVDSIRFILKRYQEFQTIEYNEDNPPVMYCKPTAIEIVIPTSAENKNDAGYYIEPVDQINETPKTFGDTNFWQLPDFYVTDSIIDKFFLSQDETTWQCYSKNIINNQFYFNYNIRNNYYSNFVNNSIKSYIYNNEQNVLLQAADVNLNFTSEGTSGTEYSLNIQLSDIGFDKSKGTDSQVEIIATPVLITPEGTVVTDNSTYGNNTWSWSWVNPIIDQRATNVSTETTDLTPYASVTTDGTLVQLSENDIYNENIKYYKKEAIGYNQMELEYIPNSETYENKQQSATIKAGVLGYDNNYALLKCTLETTIDNRKINLSAVTAIPIYKNAASIEGPTSISYDWQGSNPIWLKNTPYSLYDGTDALIPSTNAYILDGTLTTQTIMELNNDSSNKPIMDFVAKNYMICYVDYLQTLQIAQQTLMSDPITPTCIVVKNSNTFWSQCLNISRRLYNSEFLNNWNGGFEMNEKENYAMAKFFGAGTKNQDNQFTGVFMGEISSAIDGVNSKQSGLYGLQNNQLRFKLTENADFWVGTGSDYIKFDGKADSKLEIKVSQWFIETDNLIINSNPGLNENFFQIKDIFSFGYGNDNVTYIAKLSGWDIDNEKIYYPATSTTLGTGMGVKNDKPAFWAGYELHNSNNNPFTDRSWQDHTAFYVTPEGALRATNAIISISQNNTEIKFGANDFLGKNKLNGILINYQDSNWITDFGLGYDGSASSRNCYMLNRSGTGFNDNNHLNTYIGSSMKINHSKKEQGTLVRISANYSNDEIYNLVWDTENVVSNSGVNATLDLSTRNTLPTNSGTIKKYNEAYARLYAQTAIVLSTAGIINLDGILQLQGQTVIVDNDGYLKIQ